MATEDAKPRMPLVADIDSRDDTNAKDARLVNCFAERRGEREWDVVKRGGLATSSQPAGAAAVGRGVFNWRGNIYSIFGSTLYKDGVAVSGTVNATNGVYRFDSTLAPELVLGDGVKAYQYTAAGGLVAITDGDFPAAFQKGFAFLDGTLYVIKSNASIQGSDVNDATAWDPLNTIVAQIEPNQGVALGKQLAYVVAFKTTTTEVFHNAGTDPCPLAPVQGAKAEWGCASQESVQDIDGNLIWLATNKAGSRQVVVMGSMKAAVVSTAAIERVLEGWTLTTVYSWAMKYGGHKFYGLTSTVDNMTLVFDLSSRVWSYWTDASGNYLPICSATVGTDSKPIVQHVSNGYLYTVDLANTTDAGSAIPVDVYTLNFDGGVGTVKVLPRMDFIGDLVPGSFVEVRHNDYDYTAERWSPFRKVPMDVANPILTRNGSFNRRAWNVRHNLSTPLRLRAAELTVRVGSK